MIPSVLASRFRDSLIEYVLTAIALGMTLDQLKTMANKIHSWEFLWDKLPDILTDRQKEQKSHWILVDANQSAN